jgi:hypothetical protein
MDNPLLWILVTKNQGKAGNINNLSLNKNKNEKYTPVQLF